MSLPSQSFLPVLWLGSYSFLYGPNSISYDQETTTVLHPILGGHEQAEAVGFTSQKIALSGFVFSTDNKALNAMLGFQLANASSQYVNRPVSLGIFTQDAGTWPTPNSNSQIWFNEVGYLTSIHFDYQGGRANYKYPFRFNFIEEQPLIRVPTTTTIAQGTLPYLFNTGSFTDPVSGLAYTSLPPGYFAAVEMRGFLSGIATVANAAQSIVSLVDFSTSTVMGSGPSVGAGSNILFSGNPLSVLTGSGVTGLDAPTLKMPLVDSGGLQSVKIASGTSDFYIVNFAVSWATGFLPSQINLVYVPVV